MAGMPPVCEDRAGRPRALAGLPCCVALAGCKYVVAPIPTNCGYRRCLRGEPEPLVACTRCFSAICRQVAVDKGIVKGAVKGAVKAADVLAHLVRLRAYVRSRAPRAVGGLRCVCSFGTDLRLVLALPSQRARVRPSV